MLAVRGVLAVIFGVIALVWPGITALALAIVFGAYALINGVSMLVEAFRHADRPHRGARIAGGVLGVAAGVVALAWPGMTAVVLAILFGAWAVVTGVTEIAAAIRFRRQMHGEFLLGLAGLLSIIAGLIILAWPTIGVVTIAIILGIYAIMAGIVLIAMAARMRRAAHHTTHATHSPG
ncbi:MAG TPA: HdeD family acid-resistance protein [Streptosporangiaceae bacterium]